MPHYNFNLLLSLTAVTLTVSFPRNYSLLLHHLGKERFDLSEIGKIYGRKNEYINRTRRVCV